MTNPTTIYLICKTSPGGQQCQRTHLISDLQLYVRQNIMVIADSNKTKCWQVPCPKNAKLNAIYIIFVVYNVQVEAK